jgi:hypothetical protein
MGLQFETQRANNLRFMDPVLWFKPHQPLRIDFETVKAAVFTLADFYCAYSDRLAKCVYSDDMGNSLILMKKDSISPFALIRPALGLGRGTNTTENNDPILFAAKHPDQLLTGALEDASRFLQVTTALSLAALSLRAGAVVAVRVGKEHTPALFHALQPPLRGVVVHALAATVLVQVTLGVILCALKIYLRCTHTCKIVQNQNETRLNDVPPPIDEVD